MGMEFDPNAAPIPPGPDENEAELAVPKAPADVMAAFERLQRKAERRDTLDQPEVIAAAAIAAEEERARLGLSGGGASPA